MGSVGVDPDAGNDKVGAEPEDRLELDLELV